MKSVLQSQKQPTLRAAILGPVLERELHGDLDRSRTVVGEEHVIEGTGRPARDGFRELGGACVGDSGQGRVT